MNKKTISCNDCLNTTCLIKKSSSEDLINEINKNKIVNIIRKKQLIFQEENDSFNIYFIHTGIIKVFKKGAFNKDQIVRFSFNGDILGHRGLISSNIYPVSAQAITNSEICYFKKDYFFTLLNKAPQLAINLMLFFADELNQEETKLRDMAIFTVREKVAKAILFFAERFGLENNLSIKHIEKLSRQDIAELVGLTSNQVTKVLADFKTEKLIEIEGKIIRLINKAAIEKIITL